MTKSRISEDAIQLAVTKYMTTAESLKISCVNCGFTGELDSYTCPVCNGRINAQNPNKTLIYNRVFELLDEIEGLKQMLSTEVK